MDNVDVGGGGGVLVAEQIICNMATREFSDEMLFILSKMEKVVFPLCYGSCMVEYIPDTPYNAIIFKIFC